MLLENSHFVLILCSAVVELQQLQVHASNEFAANGIKEQQMTALVEVSVWA